MARNRPGPLLLLLLLLALAGGTAAVYFGGGKPESRTAGPRGGGRSPIAVVSGDRPSLPGEDPGAPDEVLHPADLLVRVLDGNDAPVAGARVLVRDARITWREDTDDRGEAPFPAVEAGPCRILARAEGRAERRAFAVLDEGGRREVVVRLGEAPVVEGIVASSLDGKPVPGATIHATPNPGPVVGPEEPPSGVSDASGAFRLRAGYKAQALTLEVRAAGFAPGRRYFPLPSTDDEVAAIRILLDPTGILRGVVRDPEGRPCPEATVFAYPAGTEARPMERGIRGASVGPGLPLAADAGPDGTYALEGLALGGLYVAGASAPGSARSEEREILLAPGGPPARADFELRRPGAIVVKWPAGAGNNEAMGSATLRDAVTRVVMASASGQGTCRFGDVAPGRYEVDLIALNAGHRGAAPVEVKAGETAVVEIAFGGEAFEPPPAVLEGRVVDAGGAPVPGVKVGAVALAPGDGGPLPSPRAEGVQVPGRTPVRVSSAAGTGADGTFRIRGLREGADYRLLATARGIFAAPGDPVRAPASGIEIRIAPLGRLKGRLVPPGGGAVPATADLRVAGPGPGDPFVSVATIPFGDGSFDTGDLVPGPCRLSAVAADCLLPRRDVEVRAGETVDLGEIPLVRGAMLAGRVVDSTGRGIPRALVEHRGEPACRAVSGEDGRFEIGPVPEGEAVLHLSLDGEIPVVRTVAASLGGEAGDLVLPRNGTLLVRASRADGRPFAGEVEVRGAAPGSRVAVLGRTDHLGRFSFTLPAREYQVVIRDPGDRSRILAEAPCSLAEGVETRVDLRAGR